MLEHHTFRFRLQCGERYYLVSPVIFSRKFKPTRGNIHTLLVCNSYFGFEQDSQVGVDDGDIYSALCTTCLMEMINMFVYLFLQSGAFFTIASGLLAPLLRIWSVYKS